MAKTVSMEKIMMDDLSGKTEESLGLRAWNAFDLMLNTFNHCLIAIVTFYTCFLVFMRPQFGTMELHIILTTLAYQLFMAESILSLSPNNSWTSPLARYTKRHMHWVTGVIAATLGIVGTSFIIANRNRHFGSIHGQLGLAAMIFLIITSSNGPFAYFAQFFRKGIKPIYLKMCHTLTASTAFSLGVACLITGFEKNFFKNMASPELSLWFVAFSSVTIILTLKSPLINMCKFIVERLCTNCCEEKPIKFDITTQLPMEENRRMLEPESDFTEDDF